MLNIPKVDEQVAAARRLARRRFMDALMGGGMYYISVIPWLFLPFQPPCAAHFRLPPTWPRK